MATRSLSLAKITKPRLQRILPRKRLYQLISESFSFPAIMIDWDELRLKLDETREMVFLWSRSPHSEASIESLHKKTDGWIAGLLLLLNRNSPRASDPEFITPYTPHEVFDYFASELFSNADPELQNFLLRTAILPRMTAKMAAAISGISDAGRILTQMMRNHWFTERRLGAGRKAPPCRRPGGTGHRSSL
jgi:ATP/maltotriose-dependent transcriptional regulator MalT